MFDWLWWFLGLTADKNSPMNNDIAKLLSQKGEIMANELFEFSDAVVILVSINDKNGGNAQTHLMKWHRGNVHAQVGMCQNFVFERALEANASLVGAIARAATAPVPPPDPPIGETGPGIVDGPPQ